MKSWADPYKEDAMDVPNLALGSKMHILGIGKVLEFVIRRGTLQEMQLLDG